MFCKDYKRFEQKKFGAELKLKINSKTYLSYSTFQAVFLESSNKIAPVKIKFYVLTTMPLWLNLSEKPQCLDPGSKMISLNKGLMKTATTIRDKGIFVLNYSARPKKNILVILLSKVLLATKNSEKP